MLTFKLNILLRIIRVLSPIALSFTVSVMISIKLKEVQFIATLPVFFSNEMVFKINQEFVVSISRWKIFSLFHSFVYYNIRCVFMYVSNNRSTHRTNSRSFDCVCLKTDVWTLNSSGQVDQFAPMSVNDHGTWNILRKIICVTLRVVCFWQWRYAWILNTRSTFVIPTCRM